MLLVFWLIERKAAEPIIAPALFLNRTLAASAIASFVVSAGLFGSLYFLPLFLQGILGQSATDSGVVMTPIMFGVLASSIAGGLVVVKTGRYKLLALLGLAAAGCGMLLLSRLTVSSTAGEAARDMFVLGLGIGISMTLFTIIVQNAFPAARIGQVTGVLSFCREIGGTIGLAVLGSVMTNRFHEHMHQHLPASLRSIMSPGQLAALSNPQLLLSPATMAHVRQAFAAYGSRGSVLLQQLLATVHGSLADAVTRGFFSGTLLILTGFIATLFLREIPLRKRIQGSEG